MDQEETARQTIFRKLLPGHLDERIKENKTGTGDLLSTFKGRIRGKKGKPLSMSITLVWTSKYTHNNIQVYVYLCTAVWTKIKIIPRRYQYPCIQRQNRVVVSQGRVLQHRFIIIFLKILTRTFMPF